MNFLFIPSYFYVEIWEKLSNNNMELATYIGVLILCLSQSIDIARAGKFLFFVFSSNDLTVVCEEIDPRIFFASLAIYRLERSSTFCP